MRPKPHLQTEQPLCTLLLLPAADSACTRAHVLTDRPGPLRGRGMQAHTRAREVIGVPPLGGPLGESQFMCPSL